MGTYHTSPASYSMIYESSTCECIPYPLVTVTYAIYVALSWDILWRIRYNLVVVGKLLRSVLWCYVCMHLYPSRSRKYLFSSSITDRASREACTVYNRKQGLLCATEQIEKWGQGPNDQTRVLPSTKRWRPVIGPLVRSTTDHASIAATHKLQYIHNDST